MPKDAIAEESLEQDEEPAEETKAEENDINTDSLANYDEESANNAIMASDKLENDFISVYFNNYMR